MKVRLGEASLFLRRFVVGLDQRRVYSLSAR